MFKIEGDDGIINKLNELKARYKELRNLKATMGDVTSSIKKLIEVDKLEELCNTLESNGIIDEEIVAISESYTKQTTPIRKEVSKYYEKIIDVTNSIREIKSDLVVESKVMKRAVDSLGFFIENSGINGLLKSPIKNKQITITVTAIKEGELISSADKSCIVFNTSGWSNETAVLKLKRGKSLEGVYVIVVTKDGLVFSDTLPDNCFIKEVIGNV